MSFGGGEVDQTSLAEDVDLASILCLVLFHERADKFRFALGHFFQGGDVDLHIEVTAVGDDGAVFHDCKVVLDQ